MSVRALELQQKRYLAGLLELACQQLELSQSQFEDAKGKYEAVGIWLAESSSQELVESTVFPQGSMRLGTTVRPLARDEFDIDLVCSLKYAASTDHPDTIRQLVGTRLREHATYRDMLVPLNRGWRLNYAESSRLHLDITPSVDNPGCANGGLLVPDKHLTEWKPSNPNGYAEWFDAHAQLEPACRSREGLALKAEIEPLPDQIPIKGLLKRIVQISKRHRDLMFADDTRKRAPISIILTTLVAQSYADAVRNPRNTHDLDLIYDVISNMDRYIDVYDFEGKPYYVVTNPTTEGENFAEKWNIHPERAEAFYTWQRQAFSNLDELAEQQGLDAIITHLKAHVIGPESTQVMSNVTMRMSQARSAGLLRASPTTGLDLATGTTVRANTFFGS